MAFAKEKAGMKRNWRKGKGKGGKNTARFCFLLKREGGGGRV